MFYTRNWRIQKCCQNLNAQLRVENDFYTRRTTFLNKAVVFLSKILCISVLFGPSFGRSNSSTVFRSIFEMFEKMSFVKLKDSSKCSNVLLSFFRRRFEKECENARANRIMQFKVADFKDSKIRRVLSKRIGFTYLLRGTWPRFLH